MRPTAHTRRLSEVRLGPFVLWRVVLAALSSGYRNSAQRPRPDSRRLRSFKCQCRLVVSVGATV